MSNNVLNQYQADSNYYSQPQRNKTFPHMSTGNSSDVLIKGKVDIQSEEGEFQMMAESKFFYSNYIGNQNIDENRSDNPKPTESEGYLKAISETRTYDENSNRFIEKDQEKDKPSFFDNDQE